MSCQSGHNANSDPMDAALFASNPSMEKVLSALPGLDHSKATGAEHSVPGC